MTRVLQPTRGPWLAEPRDEEHDVYVNPDGERTPYITINGPHSGGPDIAWVFDYEWGENSPGPERAALIASAPELARERDALRAENEKLAAALAALEDVAGDLVVAAKMARVHCVPALQPNICTALDDAIARADAGAAKRSIFSSLEDADENDFPLHATIAVRSHSAGLLFYRLMQTEDGQRFWRLTEET